MYGGLVIALCLLHNALGYSKATILKRNKVNTVRRMTLLYRIFRAKMCINKTLYTHR
jgi:hypothetical protein